MKYLANLLFIFLLLVFAACKKHISKSEIQFDINLTHKEFDIQAEAIVCIEYQPDGEHNLSYEEITVGKTENGKLNKKLKMPNDFRSGKVKLYLLSFENNFYITEKNNIHCGELCQINKEIPVLYNNQIAVKNINCSSDSDTLWLHYINVFDPTQTFDKTLVGCIDSTVSCCGPTGSPFVLNCKLKRNGLITEFTKTFNLNYTFNYLPNYLNLEY